MKRLTSLPSLLVLTAGLMACGGARVASGVGGTAATAQDGPACEPEDFSFQSEAATDDPLYLEVPCDGSLVFSNGDGYDLALTLDGQGRWSGVAEFMAHPPLERGVTLVWTVGAQTLEVVESWDEWDDSFEEPSDLDYCLGECDLMCEDDCIEQCEEEDEGDEPACVGACIEPCVEGCAEECAAELGSLEAGGYSEGEPAQELEEEDPPPVRPGPYHRTDAP